MTTLKFLEPILWSYEDWRKFYDRGIRPILYLSGNEWRRI